MNNRINFFGNGIKLSFIFFVIIFLPHVFKNYSGVNSLTYGSFFLYLLLGVFPIFFLVKISGENIKKIVFILFLILLHSIISFFLVDKKSDPYLYLANFFIFSLLISSSIFFIKLLINYKNAIKFASYVICVLLLINIFLYFLEFNIIKFSSHKPFGFFSEPSHFAISAAGFCIFIFSQRGVFKYIFGLIFFLAAIHVENLTMIFVLMISIIFNLKLNIYQVIKFLIIILIFFVFILDHDYFLERLSVGYDSDNISVLVLLRGWEQALYFIDYSNYWGIGLQRFGLFEAYGELSERFNKLGLSEINKYDAGSLLPKIIGEFGIFSIIFIILYSFMVFKSIIDLKKKSNNIAKNFFCAMILGSTVEMLFRGVGYFSGISIFYISSFLFLLNEKIDGKRS